MAELDRKATIVGDKRPRGRPLPTSKKYLRIIALGVCMALTPRIASARDDICQKLRAYELVQFSSQPDLPGRRWVEIHWLGAWLDVDKGWRLDCRHSSDNASKLFCAWLVENISFEFPGLLPRRILTCHGYRFPDRTYWRDWRAEIDLAGFSSNFVTLEIDQTEHLTAHVPDRAVRLTIVADSAQGGELTSLPPLFKDPHLSDGSL